MTTQSNLKTRGWATASLIMGILSFGFGVATLILTFWEVPSGDSMDNASLMPIHFLSVFLILGGPILGISGCISAVIAHRRNQEDSSDQKTRKTATNGLFLSILGVAIVTIVLTYALSLPKIPVSHEHPIATGLP